MFEFAAMTDPGNRYKHNEDAMGWDDDCGVWLIADGMGGHARGDVAAQTVRQAVLDNLPSFLQSSNGSLGDLIMTAHDAVLAKAAELGFHNMGSTLVIAHLADNRANIAWCGDSRAYLFRDGELLRLTSDHSLLEQLLRSGVVQPAEAFGHPQKHVLIQALGINDPRPTPSEVRLELAAGDRLLLCSDGIHDELRDAQIAEIVGAATDAQGCVDTLREQVLQGTARDNLSALCIQANELTPNPEIETLATLRARLAPPRPVIKQRPEASLEPASQPPASQAPAPASPPSIAQPNTGNSEFDREVARRRANVKAAIAAKGLREPAAVAAAAATESATTQRVGAESAGQQQNESPVLPESSETQATTEAEEQVDEVTERPTLLQRDGTWSLLLTIAVAALLASYFPWLLAA